MKRITSTPPPLVQPPNSAIRRTSSLLNISADISCVRSKAKLPDIKPRVKTVKVELSPNMTETPKVCIVAHPPSAPVAIYDAEHRVDNSSSKDELTDLDNQYNTSNDYINSQKSNDLNSLEELDCSKACSQVIISPSDPVPVSTEKTALPREVSLKKIQICCPVQTFYTGNQVNAKIFY